MADEETSSEDRTEDATARHLEQAREAGQAPVSRELGVLLGLATMVLIFSYQTPVSGRRLIPAMAALLTSAGRDGGAGMATLRDAISRSAELALPPLLATGVVGAAAVLGQTRFLLHWGAAQPNLARASPTAGLKRVFGSDGLVELLKSLLKLGLMGVAVWIAIRPEWLRLPLLSQFTPSGLISQIWRPIYRLLVAALCIQALIATADLLWVRFRHARDLRMSKQDIRDEFKETEGNPHVKARMRRIRIVRSRQRMMAKVPTATVVLTNPTHYAVALAYDRAVNPAPRVVAKGTDSLALRIREVAKANGVPIVSNPPLARALHRLDLDAEIPAEHYRAVAAIIAYVWRLRRPQVAG